MTPNIYRRLLTVVAVCLTPFFLARLGLLALYPDDFHDLGFAEILRSFVYGLRFDASILAILIGLPLLLLMLPFGWTQRSWWRGLWSGYIYAALAVLVFAMAADLIYFGIVHRHVGPEVTIISGDPDLMMDLAISDYWWAILAFVASAIGGAIAWRRWIGALPDMPGRVLPRLALIVLGLGILVVIARGGLQYKPISIVNAFAAGPVSEGYLTLNGPFSISQSMLSSQPRQIEFMPPEEARREAQALLFSPREQAVDPRYPLLRHTAGRPGDKPSVVVFLLESWDAVHIDALRKVQGLEPYNVTPVFDALSRVGRLYTRFYASGQRSMDGMAATLASVPTLPGMPYIGTGLEQTDLTFLGHLARSQGYETIFLQSSNRGSFHVDSIAARAGFQTYLGAEDIPSAHTEVTESSDWGVWDHDTFQEANRLFAAAKKPFLGFIFSSSTHQPWRIPNKQWRRFPGDSKSERYLNTLYYADWAIGEFIKAAKAAGYYDNTIFVFTGDHISHLDIKPNDTPAMYHIPLLVVGPGVKPGLDERVGSQLDVIPTLIDVAGWDVNHASLGRSLLDDSAGANRGALCVNWKNVERIEDRGWLSHNLERRVGADVRGTIQDADAMERRLQALYQTEVSLLLKNRLYRPVQPTVAAAP